MITNKPILVIVFAFAFVINNSIVSECAIVSSPPSNIRFATPGDANYWTPERMRNAIDLDVIRPPPSSRNIGDDEKDDESFSDELFNGPIVTVEGSLPKYALEISNNTQEDNSSRSNMKRYLGQLLQPELHSAFPHNMNGKLFFKKGGVDHKCSASTGGQRLVWTAGHCVRYADQWNTDFVFVPGYYNGNEPFGRFYFYQTFIHQEWSTRENYAYDYALIVMRPNTANQWVGDVVGWNGYQYGLDPATISWKIMGYPGFAPFDGTTQYHCTSNMVGRDTGSRPRPISVTCDGTGGISGGPWVKDWSATNYGYVNGIASYRQNNPDILFGPYFDAAVKTMYDSADVVVPPL